MDDVNSHIKYYLLENDKRKTVLHYIQRIKRSFLDIPKDELKKTIETKDMYSKRLTLIKNIDHDMDRSGHPACTYVKIAADMLSGFEGFNFTARPHSRWTFDQGEYYTGECEVRVEFREFDLNKEFRKK